jgi:hypothetical protein
MIAARRATWLAWTKRCGDLAKRLAVLLPLRADFEEAEVTTSGMEIRKLTGSILAGWVLKLESEAVPASYRSGNSASVPFDTPTPCLVSGAEDPLAALINLLHLDRLQLEFKAAVAEARHDEHFPALAVCRGFRNHVAWRLDDCR